jgi:hypothetical protein
MESTTASDPAIGGVGHSSTALAFEQRIASLDISLFKPIRSQSFRDDRRAWLMIQRALRVAKAGYAYLEIGSHLGGSIQQHLLDPLCAKIYSIDKRPAVQADERGKMYAYQGNSTQRMLDNLRAIDAVAVNKIECFDSDASEIDPARIGTPPDFCFIDGEHTREAAMRDFVFCLKVAAPDAVIAFHDDYIIQHGLSAVVQELDRRAIPFQSRKMPAATFAIGLRACRTIQDAKLQRGSLDGRYWLRKYRFVASLLRKLPDKVVKRAQKTVPWLLGMPRPCK